LDLTKEQRNKLAGMSQYNVKTVDELIEMHNSMHKFAVDAQFFMKDYICAGGRIIAFQQVRDEIKIFTDLPYKEKFQFCLDLYKKK
jgi:hypothetical protein